MRHSEGWLLHQKYARAFLGSSLPSPIINNCYLLSRLKSPLFYLVKSKSSDQDARCSIYHKFLHFITYIVDFFIRGQISNLITARPMASTVLIEWIALFLCRPFPAEVQRKLKSWFLMFFSRHVEAKSSSRGSVFFNKVALYNFTSLRELRTTVLGICANS